MHAFIVVDGDHVEEVKLDEMPPDGMPDNYGEERAEPLTQNQTQPELTQPSRMETQGGGPQTRNPGEKPNLKKICKFYRNGNCKYICALFRLHLEGGTSQQPFKSCLAFLRIGTKQGRGFFCMKRA